MVLAPEPDIAGGAKMRPEATNPVDLIKVLRVFAVLSFFLCLFMVLILSLSFLYFKVMKFYLIWILKLYWYR